MKNYIFLLLKATFFVLLIFMVVSFISCSREPNNGRSTPKRKIEAIARYKPGDVVYLKPDSIKAVIVRKNKCGCDVTEYLVDYYDKAQDHHTITVQETSIY